MESPPASAAADPLQPPADDSASAAAWDWGNFFDFSIVDDDSLILPWSIPDEAQTPPPLATAELPPVPLPSPPAHSPLDGSGRVRKRDPRLVCPNYLAGRVPCSCPEMDEKALEEEEVTEVVTAARKRSRTGGASAAARCQVPGCEADISELKGYHKRHRVCLRCANASSVVLGEEHKRYCQQCGKFHILPDFDEGKRSCRRKLERHNKRRRRKPNDGNNILEKEMEAQGDSPLDVTCDGEPMKETPNEFTCNTVETVVSNKVLDGDTPVDSEDGQGSPIGSLPSLKNDELAASAEVQKDERISNSKSSLSTTSCDNKSTYSPMCPTGRISFKLYDWNPAEFPRRLRHQIFQWLANMPVELEGYIRPGCTILTIFIAMPQFMWDKLSQDVAHYVRDLINTPGSLLLGRGTILIYLSNTIIHVLPDGTTLTNIKMEVQAPRLHYVCPSYFEAGKPMEFVVCGSHLKQPKFRFLISFDGKYLKHNSVCAIPIDKKSMHYDGNEAEHIDDEHEMLRIKVTHMNLEVSGPAFIEVENVSGISNFIPVLVCNKEICSELERMEEVLYGSSYASSFMSQNVITDFSPGMCGILSSRQYGMSSLLLDIAWLLKTPTPEEKEVFWNSINLQRITHLLKFLIESELSGVLQMVMHHLDNIILIKGSEKSDNGISDVDQNLFHEYFNHARKVLYQRMGHVMGSEVEQRSATSGSLMSQSSGRTNMGDKSCANQDDEVIGESLLSTSWQPASEQDVKVPLVTREIIYKQSCSQNLGIKYFFGDIFSNKIMRTRFPLFVVVSVVLCFAACIILLHPHKAGEFAVSIRRCMFGGSPHEIQP